MSNSDILTDFPFLSWTSAIEWKHPPEVGGGGGGGALQLGVCSVAQSIVLESYRFLSLDQI